MFISDLLFPFVCVCFFQDFVRLPWQNQSSHSSNALAVASSGSPASSGMSRVYSSASGQLNPGIYSSGLGNTGIQHQPLDIVSEEMESSSAQLHRWISCLDFQFLQWYCLMLRNLSVNAFAISQCFLSFYWGS